MSDLIERQAAIGLIHGMYPSAPIMRRNWDRWREKYKPYIEVEKALEQLPSAPESSIPVAWIEKHVDWLKNMNNGFATLTAMNISTMVKKWKKEQEEADGSDKTTSSD